MATPVTWSGATSVTAAASIDSDPIALPQGTLGFSAIGSMIGGSPSGIAGNLQIAVSNTGSDGYPTVLPGLLSVRASSGYTLPLAFSYLNEFYNFALLRWIQAGPYTAGTLVGWDWSISLAPPGPTPTPPSPSGAPSFVPPSVGQSPLTAGILAGYFNALFPNRWVQPPGPYV